MTHRCWRKTSQFLTINLSSIRTVALRIEDSNRLQHCFLSSWTSPILPTSTTSIRTTREVELGLGLDLRRLLQAPSKKTN